MPSRSRAPKGSRVSLHIPPDLTARLVNAPRVAAEMARVVHEIADLADQTCPVGTVERPGHEPGHLKGSQVTDVLITPKGPVGIVGYTAFYAHMVHNGTVKLTANPWLLNAALNVLVKARTSKAA